MRRAAGRTCRAPAEGCHGARCSAFTPSLKTLFLEYNKLLASSLGRPVPVLDGGHLLFYAAEAIRGRPLGQRAQEYGFRIGLALVLTLMVFATWNDLVHTGSSIL